MKKPFIIISAVFAIIELFICLYSNSGENIVVGSIVAFVFYLTILSFVAHLIHEQESFKKPYIISENDFGRMVRVAEIRDDKVALVSWGYTAYGVGDRQDTKDYYWIDGIPKSLRKVDCIFSIDPGFVFKKITFNGYKDNSKEPFEIGQQVLI